MSGKRAWQNGRKIVIVGGGPARRRRRARGEAAGRRGRGHARLPTSLRALREAAAVQGRAAPARRCRRTRRSRDRRASPGSGVDAEIRRADARRSIARAKAVVTESGERIGLRRAGARDRLAQCACCRCFRWARRASTICAPKRRRCALKAELHGAQVADRDRRRRGRARGRGLGGRAWRQGHGDRDRAAHPGARLRRGDRRHHPRAPSRARRRHPHRHRG